MRFTFHQCILNRVISNAYGLRIFCFVFEQKSDRRRIQKLHNLNYSGNVGEKKSWFFNIDVDNITNIYLTASQIKSHIYDSFACDFLGNSNLISSTILRWSGCILSHHVNEFSICRYGRKRKMHKINERFTTNSMAKRKQINQQAEKIRTELALR